jgi:hypothetical protein
MVYPKGASCDMNMEKLMVTVYDHGKVSANNTFSTIRQRVNEEWHRLPPKANVISPVLQEKIVRVMGEQERRVKAILESHNR